MMTENLQMRHIFSNDEPENAHILDSTPDDYQMDYQSIYLQTPDGEFIHAYWIYQNQVDEQTLTVLYFHGAGGNVSHRLEILRLFYENLNCQILIIDYRGKTTEKKKSKHLCFLFSIFSGFGKSSGLPSERGLYIDGQTAYDYLIYKQNISPDNIIVFGTSLGASVAIQLVSDPLNRAKLAVFENPFTSVPDVAKFYLTYAKSVIGVTKSIGFLYLFDSSNKVARIECPCVYMTGLLDPIIPTWMSTSLYNKTKSSKNCRLFEYPYGKHNDLPIMNDYFENLRSFLSELSSSSESK